MTYIIAEPCIDIKDKSCVDVCPVDCIHEFGRMVMTPRIGEYFVYGWTPPTGSDSTLGVVDFSIFPHLDHVDLPHNTMADAERWAATIDGPAYAIDDETAIKVTDGVVEVVSEGHWRHFTR